MLFSNGQKYFSKDDIIKYVETQKFWELGFHPKNTRAKKTVKNCRFLKNMLIGSLLYVFKPHISNNFSYIYQHADRRILLKNKCEKKKNIYFNLVNTSSRDISVSLGISFMKLLNHIGNAGEKRINVCIKDQKVFIYIKKKPTNKNYLNFINTSPKNFKKSWMSMKSPNNTLLDHVLKDVTVNIALPPVRMFPRRCPVPNFTSL